MASQSKVRILVAGLGSIGQRHARVVSNRDDTELLMCDPVEANLKQAHETLAKPPVRALSSYDEALAAGPDLVILGTPNPLHVPMALQAIEAGADVLVEKPISDRLDQARKLMDAADKAGRFLHVGYMLRNDEGLRRVKAAVEEGALGRIVGGRAMVGSYITLLNARSPDRLHMPNALIVDYSHEFDFIRWTCGEVKSVYAKGTVQGTLDMLPEPNVFQAILTMEGGALIGVHMDYIQHPQRRIFEIYGDQGTISYDFMTGEIRKFSFGSEHTWESMDVGRGGQRDQLFIDQLDDLLARRAAGEPPVVTGKDGLVALAVSEAAIESLATGREIDVPA